jgi:hypothetical protein
MPNQISAQQMFNGQGYDLVWLLLKAERELQRAMSSNFDFAGDAANFAVAIAHAADWAFALKPSNFTAFQKLSDVINWVHAQSPLTALFFDVSNEFKHADRTRASTTTAQLYLQFEVIGAGGNVAARADGKRLFAQGASGSTWILTPVIKDHAGNEYLFKDCDDEAIRWWKSVI